MNAESLAPGRVLKSWKLVQFLWWTPTAIVFYHSEAETAQMLIQNESTKPSHQQWLFWMSFFETYPEIGPRTTCQSFECCLCGNEITADLPQVCSWLWHCCAYQVSLSVAVQLDELRMLVMFNSRALAHALLLAQIIEAENHYTVASRFACFPIILISTLVSFWKQFCVAAWIPVTLGLCVDLPKQLV